MPTPRIFEKVLMDLIGPNVSKNLVKTLFFLIPFLAEEEKKEKKEHSSGLGFW